MLTGKCKTDFEKWWYKQLTPALTGELHHFSIYGKFKDLTPSMQYGVYVDFFRQTNNRKAIEHAIYDFCENCEIGFTTEEAITLAINKAMEIHNEKQVL